MKDHTRLLIHGHTVGRIGFGCWQLAGAYTINGRPNGYGSIDAAEAVRTIHAALENGINFFDTAAGYGDGRSEEVLGDALHTYSGTGVPLICTKYSATDDARWAEEVTTNVEASLRRLRVEQLGAILLHNPPDDIDLSAIDKQPFERLIEEGKISAYGVSCRSQKGVANVLRHSFGSVIEAVYNPLDRRYEAFFSDPAYKDKYTFISRVPLASGFFSKRTLAEARTFAADDIRSGFNDEQVAWVSEAVRSLAFLDELEGGITVSALRFQLSNQHHTLTIPGIRNTVQLNDALLAMRLGPLPHDVLTATADAVPDVFYKWR